MPRLCSLRGQSNATNASCSQTQPFNLLHTVLLPLLPYCMQSTPHAASLSNAAEAHQWVEPEVTSQAAAANKTAEVRPGGIQNPTAYTVLLPTQGRSICCLQLGSACKLHMLLCTAAGQAEVLLTHLPSRCAGTSAPGSHRGRPALARTTTLLLATCTHIAGGN
jgi:hypothetical protein